MITDMHPLFVRPPHMPDPPKPITSNNSYLLVQVAPGEGPEDAIKASGLRVGQMVRISNLLVSASGSNQYAIIPQLEIVPETQKS